MPLTSSTIANVSNWLFVAAFLTAPHLGFADCTAITKLAMDLISVLLLYVFSLSPQKKNKRKIF